jgi:hypothetical protein
VLQNHWEGTFPAPGQLTDRRLTDRRLADRRSTEIQKKTIDRQTIHRQTIHRHFITPNFYNIDPRSAERSETPNFRLRASRAPLRALAMLRRTERETEILTDFVKKSRQFCHFG